MTERDQLDPAVDPIVDVHVTRPGRPLDGARCGAAAAGVVVTWEAATDPHSGVHFGCPACWADIVGPGVEPMGGSRVQAQRVVEAIERRHEQGGRL